MPNLLSENRFAQILRFVRSSALVALIATGVSTAQASLLTLKDGSNSIENVKVSLSGVLAYGSQSPTELTTM